MAQGWDEAANDYDAYFLPRVAPWVDAAAEAITAAVWSSAACGMGCARSRIRRLHIASGPNTAAASTGDTASIASGVRASAG